MLSHVIILIDVSCSMQSHIGDFTRALNSFIYKLKETNCRLTIGQFSINLSFLTEYKDIKNIPEFNVNQFNVYWSSYMAEITDKDSRLLTGTFKLNYKDIFGLDFSSFIYVDGVKFRLNKIEDFNATFEDTCKVELLKIINEVY